MRSMAKETPESGFALVSVLVALALLTTIGVAVTGIGTVEYRTSLNHRSATRALLMADAGATHALALMRSQLSGYTYSEILKGSDYTWDTGDDGYLMGYGLDAVDELPDTGIAMDLGRYSVRIINDPGDPSGDPAVDSNFQIIAICSGQTRDGGVAEIRALLTASAFPAVASNGDLVLPGNPLVTGPCASVHANGSMEVSGMPTIDGELTATGIVTVAGTITDSDGYEVTPRSDEPPIEIPDYDPMEYCDDADYRLRNGWLITFGATVDSVLANGSKPLGWQWDPAEQTYTLFAKDAVPGTVCADTNIKVNGSLGSPGDPFQISLIASGSIQINGTPVIEADHPDGILVMAGGDVQAGGNAAGGTPFYDGMLYSYSQCQINGNPVINGFILCHNAANPPGTSDLMTENKVNGNPTITNDCSGIRQRTSIAAWWESRA